MCVSVDFHDRVWSLLGTAMDIDTVRRFVNAVVKIVLRCKCSLQDTLTGWQLETGWQSKTAAMNGKLYAVGDSHSLEGKNEISVYNVKKDCWETITGVLEDSAPVLAWGPELVSLGGRLCIVGTGLLPRVGTSRAAVAIVEVNDSKTDSVKSSATLRFYEDITGKIQFADPLPRGACQVLALWLHLLYS